MLFIYFLTHVVAQIYCYLLDFNYATLQRFMQRYRRRWNSTIVTISSKINMSSLDNIVTIVAFYRRRYRCINRCRVA